MYGKKYRSLAPMNDQSANSSQNASCHACGKSFVPRLAFQREEKGGALRYFCSLPCRAAPTQAQTCSVCSGPVTVQFAYQVLERQGTRAYLCSERCRDSLAAPQTFQAAETEPVQHRVAVLNQKGGTGKTTTAISLSAGLAEAGRRVLLIDADPQGNVAVSLGLRPRHTLYHVMVENMALDDAVVPIGGNFDVLGSDDSLAKAEWSLAQTPNKGGVLSDRLQGAPGYDHVVIDCGPALSLVNQNVLCFAGEVLVPVACEYLSLVGVKQLLATVKRVNMQLGHPLEVGGVLPTFFDSRLRSCQEALDSLRQHFGARCLPPIHANVRLKEAPRHKKTIFEYDTNSAGAMDYRAVVAWMLHRTAQVQAVTPIPAQNAMPASPMPATNPTVVAAAVQSSAGGSIGGANRP